MASSKKVEESLVSVIKALEYLEKLVSAQPPPMAVDGEIPYWTLIRELKTYIEQAKRDLN